MKYFNLTSLLLVSGWSITQAQALAVPEDIERRSLNDLPGHGNYGRSEDGVFRYHEIRDGLFTGVDPKEWDDNVHKRHVYHAFPEARDDNLRKRHVSKADKRDYVDDFKSFKLESLTGGSSESDTSQKHKRDAVDDFKSYELESLTGGASELVSRDLVGTCTTSLRCASKGLVTGGHALYGYGEKFISKVRELGPNVMDVLNEPMMANFAGVGGQNILVTGIFYAVEKGSSSSKPETCSENLSQAEALRALLKIGCETSQDTSSFEVTMRAPDGTVWGFYLKTESDTVSESDICKKQG